MIRVVRLSFKDEHKEDFLAFFHDRKERIRAVQGCTYLQLWRDDKNENVFYTYSMWDANSFLESYRNSAFFRETWSQVKQWFSESPMAFSANDVITLP